jgi:hypothetical protein
VIREEEVAGVEEVAEEGGEAGDETRLVSAPGGRDAAAPGARRGTKKAREIVQEAGEEVGEVEEEVNRVTIC